jgi:hypothetical protein
MHLNRAGRVIARAFPWLVIVILAANGAHVLVTRSAAAAPQTFTDDPIVPGVTVVRAVHVDELRTRINQLRVLRRLAGYSWTDPTLAPSVTSIRAVHVTELRTALADAYLAVGRQPPTYTAPSPAAGESIRAAHIDEIRSAVLTLEGTEPLCKMCSAPEPVLAQGFTTNAAGLFDCKWRDRTSLSVTFLDGDPTVQARVMAAARQWEPHIGITLNVVSSPPADIRISFGEVGRSWSKLGSCTESATVTMNYGWLFPSSSDEEYRSTVLHQFGHAFGLIHEHQHPGAAIPWDVPRVYEWCRVQGWDTATCNANMFERPRRTNFSQYDPLSTMVYAIDNSLTTGDFETARNNDLAARDRTFITTWYTHGPWTDWPQPEDQYLVGNWDAGTWQAGTHPGDKLAVRRNNYVLMALNYDAVHDFIQGYGNGNSESEYLAGDWNGDGKDNLAVRRGNCVDMDFDFDGASDRSQCFGNGADEDQYLVGDWDGDGRDNLAVRHGNCVDMDFNFDEALDQTQCYGDGAAEDQYLVGDWDGDGKSNLAVRRDNCVIMDTNFDANGDLQQCYGSGNSEDGYVVGDWNGDGRDNLAVRRGNCFQMDVDFDAAPDREQCYGTGFAGVAAGPLALTAPARRAIPFAHVREK